MKEIPLSKFRRNISRILKSVRRSRQPILITRSGERLAEIVPIARQSGKRKQFGDGAASN